MQFSYSVNVNHDAFKKALPLCGTSMFRKMAIQISICCLTFPSERASSSEKQHFFGFASFVSGLGPHPFIPELLGVVSVQPPPMMVVEELLHRDLLGYLWRCRQVSFLLVHK